MTTPTFFPSDQRKKLDYVLNDFPFPLAVTYKHLHDALEHQKPVDAVWRLRDAFECAVKFSACLAIADFFNTQPSIEQTGDIVKLLFKPSGLSLGDWHSLIELSLESLKPFASENNLQKSGRPLAALFTCFFKSGGRQLRTKLNDKIDGKKESFVPWRNTMAHGAFQNDAVYARDTLRWLKTLHEFYNALRPVVKGWQLVSRTAEGAYEIWQGTGDIQPFERHEHEASEPGPQPLYFIKQSDSHSLKISFGPLLSVQTCDICNLPAAFFFQKNRYKQKQDIHRTAFLEYFKGHQQEQRDWQEVRELANLTPPDFEWQRDSFDAQEATDGVLTVFRSFEDEYLRPAYLLDAFWNITDNRAKGYIWLSGDEGTGKTYFVRGLEKDGADEGAPVLAYFIRPGALADYRMFIIELADLGRAQLQFVTQEIQSKGATINELRKEFSTFLKELMRKNKLETLIVAIDALDELPAPEPGSAAITALLPHPDQLPEGCFVLLTSRPNLHLQIQADLDRLRSEPAKRGVFTVLDVSPESPANRELVRAYLKARLPVRFGKPEHIKTVLKRCRGIFLYAFHFCHALQSGAFPDIDDLPQANQLNPVYLNRLHEQVGDDLYHTVYLQALLLLAAARQPVTLEMLARWGIPSDRLNFALPDLRDFLSEKRIRSFHEGLNEIGDNRYEIAHEAFTRFLQNDPHLSSQLRDAHAKIARCALAHSGKWDKMDPADDADLYDLRFVMGHLRDGGMDAEMAALMVCGRVVTETQKEWVIMKDNVYAAACHRFGKIFWKKARHYISLDLYDCALHVYRYLLEEEGRMKFATDLSSVLNNKGLALNDKGLALNDMGNLSDAISCYDEALGIYQRIVKKDGRMEFANDLGSVLINKGNALRTMGNLKDASACFDEAIHIYLVLVEKEGREEFADGLAKALNNKGAALADIGILLDAVVCYDEAILIYRRLIEEKHFTEFANNLASVLNNKGTALSNMGDMGSLSDAAVCFDETIAIRRLLVEEKGRKELADDLASAVMNKGLVLSEMGSLSDAAACFDESISICRHLVEVERRTALADLLALVLSNKGSALKDMRSPSDAIVYHDEAIGIIRRLFIEENRTELASNLAKMLDKKGSSLQDMGKLSKAVACYDEAICILMRLVEKEGRKELADDLAGTLNNKGLALMAMGSLFDATYCYDEAICIFRRLIEEKIRMKLANGLALVLNNKGKALGVMGNLSDANACYDEAIALCEAVVKAGLIHTTPHLINALKVRFLMKSQDNDWQAAAQDVIRVFKYALPVLQSDSPSEMVMLEFGKFMKILSDISDLYENILAALYAELGSHAEIVKKHIEQFRAATSA